MILAAGHRMRQIYNHNMGKVVKILSVKKLADKYSINPTKLFEMLKGVKYGRQMRTSRDSSLILELDMEKDASVPSMEETVAKAKKLEKKRSKKQKVKATKMDTIKSEELQSTQADTPEVDPS